MRTDEEEELGVRLERLERASRLVGLAYDVNVSSAPCMRESLSDSVRENVELKSPLLLLVPAADTNSDGPSKS